MESVGCHKAWKAAFAALAFLLSSCLLETTSLASSSVILTWDANPEPDVEGYKIYMGTASGNYSQTNNVGNVVVATLSGLTTGTTYYFVATAYNTSGLESDYSNEISFTPTSSATNNPPVISLSASLQAQKEIETAIPSLVISDADAGNGNVTVTLSTSHGKLYLSSTVTGGLTTGHIAGNGSANVTVNSPLAVFNATVNNPTGFRYTGNLNFTGTDTLVVTANDNGNSGSGGARSATKSMTVIVTGTIYDEWLSQSFNTSELSNPANEPTLWGELADPDKDGQSNLLEFAVGSNPAVADLEQKAVYTQVEDASGQKYFSLVFKRRKNQSIVQYHPEVSADQSAWFSGNGHVREISAVSLNADFELVTYQDLTPITIGNPRFIRLRIVTDLN